MAYRCQPTSISALTSIVNDEPGLSAWAFSRSSDQTTGVCAVTNAPAAIKRGGKMARLKPRPTYRLPPYKAATLHDHGDLADRADRLRRIALHGDQVGEEVRRDAPDLRLHVQHIGVNRRRGPQRVERRHAVRHHDFELARIVAVGKHAHVR